MNYYPLHPSQRPEDVQPYYVTIPMYEYENLKKKVNEFNDKKTQLSLECSKLKSENETLKRMNANLQKELLTK